MCVYVLFYFFLGKKPLSSCYGIIFMILEYLAILSKKFNLDLILEINISILIAVNGCK